MVLGALFFFSLSPVSTILPACAWFLWWYLLQVPGLKYQAPYCGGTLLLGVSSITGFLLCFLCWAFHSFSAASISRQGLSMLSVLSLKVKFLQIDLKQIDIIFRHHTWIWSLTVWWTLTPWPTVCECGPAGYCFEHVGPCHPLHWTSAWPPALSSCWRFCPPRAASSASCRSSW